MGVSFTYFFSYLVLWPDTPTRRLPTGNAAVRCSDPSHCSTLPRSHNIQFCGWSWNNADRSDVDFASYLAGHFLLPVSAVGGLSLARADIGDPLCNGVHHPDGCPPACSGSPSSAPAYALSHP